VILGVTFTSNDLADLSHSHDRARRRFPDGAHRNLAQAAREKWQAEMGGEHAKTVLTPRTIRTGVRSVDARDRFLSDDPAVPLATASVSGFDWRRRAETRTVLLVAVGVAGIVATAVTAWAVANSPILVGRSGDVIWRGLFVARADCCHPRRSITVDDHPRLLGAVREAAARGQPASGYQDDLKNVTRLAPPLGRIARSG